MDQARGCIWSPDERRVAVGGERRGFAKEGVAFLLTGARGGSRELPTFGPVARLAEIRWLEGELPRRSEIAVVVRSPDQRRARVSG